ncbi:MAG: sce7726 family protein [Oscillospiraceae bacterium]|nr:sce7726 family protein [Oscillospiraceae bacterium]
MKDKEIRNILIAFLKARCREVRIYNEKSIGSAVCDVMAVTDKLIGFEIKSDGDNYQRLDRQIYPYNKFFDKIYIVVSRRHIASAEAKVPKHWGIIYIVDDGVEIARKAGENEYVSRRNQLSLLWKLELKNLLVKNHLPLFAQREKGYIADKIAQIVEDRILGPQIAEELLRRDYSIYNAEDYTTYSRQEAFRDIPALDIIDTLSEANFEQITLDKWIGIYKQAKEVQKEKGTIYVKEAVERTPHEITYENIEVSLGAPWVSVDIVNEFANNFFLKRDKCYRILVEHEPITGAWFVNEKRGFRNSNIDAKYGTLRYNALYILEATLNLREIKIYDDDGKLSEADTIAVLEKQRLINEEFKAWVWEDEDRRWRIEEAYNKMFAGLSQERFDGSGLTFPEMAPEYDLYDYQRDAAARIISTKNTLLAFDVGAGKTYIMIAAAMKMREMGISQKNMFVVPNNIVGQWEKIFTSLYPRAKVLTIEPKTFKPEMRQKALGQMQKGDYDGIIIAYSCFEMIPLSIEYLTDDMEEQAGRINDAIKDLRSGKSHSWGESALRREIQNIEMLAKELLKSAQKKAKEITFDSLEINTVFLDEAHNFKNIPLHTKLRNLRGINTKGSKNCLEMLQKIRCVQRQNNGRGAVLATGTPLCNSISDAYTMQMYLQYDDLARNHLDQFDNWVKTFARPEQVCEVDVTAANFRFVTRFAKFFNLPELARMFSGIAVFHSMDDADGLPDVAEYTDVTVKKSDELGAYMQKICERTEAIRKGEVVSSCDNMLKVSTDGRKAALDLTLVGEEQPYNEYSKLVRCAEQVMEVYERNQGCSQLIFCDYSTPKANEFNVYAKIKELLVERGIPEKEIAFVHSYKSESTRLKMYEEVNSAKIRVLIGSTFKLGIGANVQTKLKAVHHLDVPWRPADMTQREGRILRRGNENKEVTIYRYIAKGSFDSYSWQILEAKQRFISQFLSGSPYQRSIEDLDNNVLSYAEVKAIALSDPIMKRIAEKENEIKTLEIIVNKHMEMKKELKERLAELETELPAAKARLDRTVENRAYLKNISHDKYLSEIAKYRGILTEKYIKASSPGAKLFTFLGFKVILAETGKDGKAFITLNRNEVSYRLEMGESAAGNLKRITNLLTGFSKTVKAEQEVFQKKQKEYDETKISLELPGDQYDRLVQCKKELEELMCAAERSSMINEKG